jgi:PAS domain S-box-containing protein
MDDNRKTKKELIKELQDLRRRMAELEKSENECKRAKEALRIREEKHRILLEESPDPIFSFGTDGRYLYVNKAFAKGVGKDVGEIIGKTIWDVFPKEEADRRFAALDQTFRTGEEKVIEVRVPRPDGDQYYLTTITPIKSIEGLVLSAICSSKNITERKQAEKRQRESEARFKDLAELLPEIVFEIDLNGILTFSNKNAFAEFGYTQEDLAGGVNIFNLVTPEDQGRALENMQRILNGGVIGPNEYLMLRKDGSVFPALIFSAAIFHDGQPVGLRGFVVDITDRKQMEDALRASEEGFRRIFEEAHQVGIVITLPSFVFEKANPAFCRMMGYSADELRSMNFEDITHPDHLKQDMENVKKVGRGEIPFYQTEKKYLNKSGKVLWGNLIVSSIRDEHGALKYYLSMVIDITKQMEAVELLLEATNKYQELAESISDVFFAMDKNLRYTYWNKASENLTGISAEKALGKSLMELFPDNEARKQVNDMYLLTINTKKPQHLTVSYPGDELMVYEISSYPTIEGVSVFVKDITERKLAEEEKRKLAEKLQRAEKMEALGTLAGGVAHDLNNVLGIIVGFSELLLYDVKESSPLRSSLINIMEGSKRAAAIVQDLLTMARRGVSGRQVLNLNKIIFDCRNSPEFKDLSSYHPSVEIKTDIEPDLLNISGSSVHIGKTIFNLVSNASEAMPKGGTLTIKTSNQYLDRPIQGYDEVREGDYVVLSVSDTGEGIADTDLQRIFEPFYTKKVMGRSGTGLGLAVVWGTVKDHNGYVNVQSEEGKGSTFTLYFPVTRKEIADEAVAVSISEYLGKRETILIVDDIKGQRDLATTMLRKLNYKVTSVSSGEEAVAYLKEQGVDLLVLDMIMDPGMDGLETYKRILEIHPRQKAIIVSGFSESDRVHSAQALGAGAYVRKPYVIEKLGLAVKKELDRAT